MRQQQQAENAKALAATRYISLDHIAFLAEYDAAVLVAQITSFR